MCHSFALNQFAQNEWPHIKRMFYLFEARPSCQAETVRALGLVEWRGEIGWSDWSCRRFGNALQSAIFAWSARCERTVDSLRTTPGIQLCSRPGPSSWKS